MPTKAVWTGPRPEKCDVCKAPLAGKNFVDGRTTRGPWACMCLDCHKSFGMGLGTGRGQEYNANNEKVAG